MKSESKLPTLVLVAAAMSITVPSIARFGNYQGKTFAVGSGGDKVTIRDMKGKALSYVREDVKRYLTRKFAESLRDY